jgi:hypothetical protein
VYKKPPGLYNIIVLLLCALHFNIIFIIIKFERATMSLPAMAEPYPYYIVLPY